MQLWSFALFEPFHGCLEVEHEHRGSDLMPVLRGNRFPSSKTPTWGPGVASPMHGISSTQATQGGARWSQAES